MQKSLRWNDAQGAMDKTCFVQRARVRAGAVPPQGRAPSWSSRCLHTGHVGLPPPRGLVFTGRRGPALTQTIWEQKLGLLENGRAGVSLRNKTAEHPQNSSIDICLF